MFCIGCIISAVYECKVQGYTQKGIVENFIRSIDTGCQGISDETASDIARGKKNPSKYMMDALSKITDKDYEGITDYFQNNIVGMVMENRRVLLKDSIIMMIMEDSDIQNDTVIEVISGIKKSELVNYNSDLAIFLAGVFLYALKNTKNNVGGGIKPIVKGYIERMQSEEAEARRTIGVISLQKEKNIEIVSQYLGEKERTYEEEKIDQEAVNFCLKYDKQKDFIPLCQIVNKTNPMKFHQREIFNEFNRCTRRVRNSILEKNDVDIINITDNEWWWQYLDRFKEDYINYKMGEISYLYSFGQYFPRLIDVEDICVEKYLHHYFPVRVMTPFLKSVPNYKHDILSMIDEYIYYKNDRKHKKLLEPPMDFLWRELQLGACKESELTAWLALVIIGTCKAIPFKDSKDDGAFTYSFPFFENLKTGEDLFYVALMALYESFPELHKTMANK